MVKDLILLVADKNAEHALKGALNRPQAMGIRPISFEILVHPGRDGGARTTGSNLLKTRARHFNHALLIFDFEGSGTARPDGPALEEELDERLKDDWGDAAKAIVIEPELDVWIWGSDNAMEPVIGWNKDGDGLRAWLKAKGFAWPHKSALG